MNVYPVIHVQNPAQAVEQTAIAKEAGADGVFLIDHKIVRPELLIESYNFVRAEYPKIFVGLNYLIFEPTEGYVYTKDIAQKNAVDELPNALWFDDALPGARTLKQAQNYLKQLQNYRAENPELTDVEFFGGVSFKYTLHYNPLPVPSAHMAAELGPFIDTVTTSGVGTGSAPGIDKVKAMKAAVGTKKLAVASGISLENVAAYTGLVDVVLIASSLETAKYSGIFIPEKVQAFVATAHDN